MKTIEKPLSLGVHMSNNLDEILSLTKEITYQDGDDFDITVTEYGEELSKTKDIEFLWIARNTSSTVKKASTNIKSFNDQNIAKNVEENGPVRLGDEVFVFNKSYSWKVQDLRKFIEWIIKKSNNNEELVESLLAILGQTFVPKLKGLDAFSNSKNINPEMIRDTFLYKEWKDKAGSLPPRDGTQAGSNPDRAAADSGSGVPEAG